MQVRMLTIKRFMASIAIIGMALLPMLIAPPNAVAQAIIAEVDCNVSIIHPGDNTTITSAEVLVTGTAAVSQEVDLILLMDSSNSLNWNDPLDRRKDGAKALVEALCSHACTVECGVETRLGLISFNHNVPAKDSPGGEEVFLELASIGSGEECGDDAVEVIEKLPRWGRTNIGGAILAAIAEFEARGRPDALKKVILFSDGQPTAGPDPIEAAEAARDAGIIINTVFLDVDDDCLGAGAALMEEIANITCGFSACVTESDDLINKFIEALPSVDDVEMEINGQPVMGVELTEECPLCVQFSVVVPLECGENTITATAIIKEGEGVCEGEERACGFDTVIVTREGEECCELVLRKDDENGEDGFVDPGGTIDYSICYSNLSQCELSNAVITDELPNEVAPVLPLQDGCIYSQTDHTIICDIGTISSGAEGCVEFSVIVSSGVNLCTEILNVAHIVTDEVTERAEETTLVSCDCPTITKSSNVDEDDCVKEEQTIIYSICFYNPNDVSVDNVLVTDELPNEVAPVLPLQDGCIYSQTAHMVICEMGSLGPGEKVCFDMEVEVDQDVPGGTIITNTAIIGCGRSRKQREVSEDTLVCPDPLNIIKMDNLGPSGCARVGGTIDYDICFGNAGDLDIPDVFLVDELPNEVTFEQLLDDRCIYSQTGHTVTCDIGIFSAGKQDCVNDLIVKVNSDTTPGITITNFVFIDTTNSDPIYSNVRMETSEDTRICSGERPMCGVAYINYITLHESDPETDVPLEDCRLWLTLTLQDGRTFHVEAVAKGTQLNIALLKAFNFNKRISVCVFLEPGVPGIFFRIIKAGFNENDG